MSKFFSPGIQISACHLFICLQKVNLQVQVECTDSSIETYHVFLCLLSILYPFVSRFTITIQDNFKIDRKFCKYDPNFWTILLQWLGILSGIQISACQPFNCLGSSFPLPLIYSPVPWGRGPSRNFYLGLFWICWKVDFWICWTPPLKLLENLWGLQKCGVFSDSRPMRCHFPKSGFSMNAAPHYTPSKPA